MRVLIAGGGEVGALIARRLIKEGSSVTILEADPDRCAYLQGSLDAHVVRGNAGRVLPLREAGIAQAEMLIAVTDSDEINVLTCLIAQVESRARIKVARLRTHEVDHWKRLLAQAGVSIDLIIHPETEIAGRIMRVVGLPGISDMVELADGEVRLFGLTVDADGPLANRSLEDLRTSPLPREFLVPLVFRGPQVIVPRGRDILRPGDQIYAVTTAASLPAVLAFLGIEPLKNVRRVFVMGGRQIGIEVARRLEDLGAAVRLFERDARRCERVAGILRHGVVIHADGTDQTALEEAGVDSIDAFLALSDDDEDNIIASLLARRLGARKLVALVNRLNYLALAQRLGINSAISPRLVAVDRILQFVRKGRVLSVTSFREEEAEAIELIAGSETRYVGKRLRDVRFPNGAIVGAIVRPSGEVVVPTGEETIEAGDRVIFFAVESAVARLESAFLAPGSGRQA